MKNSLYSIAKPLRSTMAYFYESKLDDCANIWNDLHIYDVIPMILRKAISVANVYVGFCLQGLYIFPVMHE